MKAKGTKIINELKKLMQSYRDGMVGVIEVLKELKEIETLLDDYMQEIKPKAVNFLEANNKSYDAYGYRFSIRVRTTYDYSHIKPIVEAEKQISQFEKYLDGLKEISKRGGH